MKYLPYVRDCLDALALECSPKDAARIPPIEKLYNKLHRLEGLAAKIDRMSGDGSLSDEMQLTYPKRSLKLRFYRAKFHRQNAKVRRLQKQFWK